MNYRDIIRTANANLRKSKLRTFLTISAVFMGAFTLMLTTGIGAGLKAYVDEQVGAVGAKDVLYIMAVQPNENPFGSNDPKEYDPERKQAANVFGNMTQLQDTDLKKIRATKGITSIEPQYPINAEFLTTGGKKYQGTVTQTVEGMIQPLRSGRLVRESTKSYEVTLPPELVKPLGFASDQAAVNKKVTFGFKNAAGNIFTIAATVTGVQEKTLINANQITANTALVRDAYDTVTTGLSGFQKSSYGAAFARFDPSLTEEQVKQLKESLKKQGYEGSTLQDQLGIIHSVINGITTFLKIFAGIALAAASFGIVNTLLMAVQERTREIGLMKALGMGRGKIFMLFSLEAILIGFWGALVALGVANIVGRIGSSIATRTIFKDFEGLQLFSFPALSMLPILLLVMAIAFLAATLPARRAARLDPIEALRYE